MRIEDLLFLRNILIILVIFGSFIFVLRLIYIENLMIRTIAVFVMNSFFLVSILFISEKFNRKNIILLLSFLPAFLFFDRKFIFDILTALSFLLIYFITREISFLYFFFLWIIIPFDYWFYARLFSIFPIFFLMKDRWRGMSMIIPMFSVFWQIQPIVPIIFLLFYLKWKGWFKHRLSSFPLFLMVITLPLLTILNSKEVFIFVQFVVCFFVFDMLYLKISEATRRRLGYSFKIDTISQDVVFLVSYISFPVMLFFKLYSYFFIYVFLLTVTILYLLAFLEKNIREIRKYAH